MTNVILNREALAWAAGFFDGEGCVRAHGKNRAPIATLAVAQNAPELLHRFALSVHVGAVRGPHRNGQAKPMWAYRVGSFEGVQAVVALLWTWLGAKKREDAKRTLRAANHGRPSMSQIQAAKTHCKRGHPFDADNTAYRVTRGRIQRQCRVCRRADKRRYLERKKAAAK